MATDKLILPTTASINNWKIRLMKLIGNMSMQHFNQSFKLQRFNDSDSEEWRDVKRREKTDSETYKYGYGGGGKYKRKEGYKKGSKSDRTRPILIGKGSANLSKSLNMTEVTATTVRIETIGTAEQYADVHNEGLRSGRGQGFQMPKREFIGESELLNHKIEQKIEQELAKLFM
jgi:phage gpG-like protein